MAGALCLAAGHVRRGVLSALAPPVTLTLTRIQILQLHPHTDTDPADPPSLVETDPIDLRPLWRKQILDLRPLWRKQISVTHSSGNRSHGSPLLEETSADPGSPPSLAETDLGYHSSGNRPLGSPTLEETDPGSPPSLAETHLGYPFLGEQIPVLLPLEEKDPGSPPSLAETDLVYPFLGKQLLVLLPWRKQIQDLRPLWRKQILVTHSSGFLDPGSPYLAGGTRSLLSALSGGNRSWLPIPREKDPGSLIPRGNKSFTPHPCTLRERLLFFTLQEKGFGSPPF